MIKVLVLCFPLFCAVGAAEPNLPQGVPPSPAANVAGSSLSVQDCVAVALQNNAGLAQTSAKVDELQARLAAVRSVYWPKLSSVAFVAPMYTVKGNGYSNTYLRRYQSLSDWGPYTNLEAMAVQPLYTFGRAEAGADPVRQRQRRDHPG
jgi:outer membrane protein TolC